MADDGTEHVRAQGREAKKLNEEEGGQHFGTISAHSCPYGSGDNRDAWLEGFSEKQKKSSTKDQQTGDLT